MDLDLREYSAIFLREENTVVHPFSGHMINLIGKLVLLSNFLSLA